MNSINWKSSTLNIVHKYWGLLAIVVLSFMGVLLILYFTRSSPGMSGDSVWYIMGAENLLAGDGYGRTSGGGEIKPITGFPPFTSIVLSGFGALGFDLVQSSRWLNAIMFGVSAFLTWRLIHQYTRSNWASIGGALLFLGSSSLIKYHSWVMSEGLYIFLSLTVFSSLTAYVHKGRRSAIIVAAILTGAGILTKYVGISLLISGVFVIFFSTMRDRKSKIIDMLAYVSIVCLPLAGWFFRNSLVSESLTNRAFSFHPMSFELYTQYKFEIGNWFLLHRLVSWESRFLIAVLLGVIGPLFFISSQTRTWLTDRSKSLRKQDAIPWMLIINTVVFLLILLLNSFFLDAGTTPSAPERYIAPLYASSIILIIATTYDLLSSSNLRGVLKPAFSVVLSFIIFLHIQTSFELYEEEGIYLGYQTMIKENPTLVAGLRDLSEDHQLFSDNVELVYMLTGRTAYFLPVKYSVYAQQPNEDFPEKLAQTINRLRLGGRVIIFAEVDEEPDLQEVINELGVEILEVFPGATVYGYGER